MKLNDINPFVRWRTYFDASVERQRFVPLAMPADCRLIYGLEGKVKISIKGKLFTLKPCDMLIINAGVKYKTYKSKGKTQIISFDYTQKFSHIKYAIHSVTDINNITEKVELEDHPELNEYIYCENLHTLKSIIRTIITEYEKKLPDYDIITSSLLKSVIFTAVRKAVAQKRINTNIDIEKLVLFIHENYKGNLNNNILSEHFHFHPNYINNVFKKYMGQTIHKYIIELRITNAISLLEESDLSIDEIARETGFYDCSYFSKYFKKATGVSPKAYRQKK